MYTANLFCAPFVFVSFESNWKILLTEQLFVWSFLYCFQQFYVLCGYWDLSQSCYNQYATIHLLLMTEQLIIGLCSIE